MPSNEEFLRDRLDEENYAKLAELGNSHINEFVAHWVDWCNPDTVSVITDAPEDIDYVRQRALETGEEIDLAMEGHTAHFDGPHDQARDKDNTKYLVEPGMDLGERLNCTDKQEGLEEVRGYLRNNMEGKELFVRFFCLGPRHSEFSIPCVQLTDSAYVAHSEDILYRQDYEEFAERGEFDEFFRFVHSQGRLEGGVSAEVDKRRVYIDLDDQIVYSTNTQYGGNTIGLKKLALRLALRKADREGWLAEHMLLMGVYGPNDRLTYFTGAYPSACGKTSTAMLPGESIVGDDIAYLREIDGEVRAANVESGIFGIIRDVNKDDDPIIWKALNEPGEIIFSNILVTDDGIPYWLGKGEEPPKEGGRNYAGRWEPGMTDKDGKKITVSHKNARYTLKLEALDNCDPHLHDADGVEVSGIIYGGRDSDTCVPVEESFDWVHGVITKGASLESETTAATLGKEGVRVFNPMSNIDFVSLPLGRYIQDHLDFGEGLNEKPSIFGVNYFLKEGGETEGDYLNAIEDKKVWVKWMEKRVHGDVGARSAPTGFIPLYEDLEELFKQHLDKGYSRDQYEEQFAIRVDKSLDKIDRIVKIYEESVKDVPQELFDVLEAQRDRLEALRESNGDEVSPFDLPLE